MSIANDYYNKEKVLFDLIDLRYRASREGRFYVWRTDHSDKHVVHI